MKKLKLSFMMMIAMAGAVVMNGCGPDGDDPEPGPTLNFLGGAEFVSSDKTLPVNTAFQVGIEANHETRIKKLEISVSYNGGPRVTPVGCTMCDSTLNSKDLSTVFKATTNNIPGKEKWFFAVIDGNNNKTEKSFTITTTAPPKNIVKVNVSMGNQDASIGSSLALDIAEVLTIANAKAASARIDLIYVTSETEGDIMCAPSSQSAGDLLTGTSGVTSWSTRNATKLRKTNITDTEFEAMTDNSLLVQALQDMSSASGEVKDFLEGDVLVVDPVSTGGLVCLVLIETVNLDNTITIKIAFEDN